MSAEGGASLIQGLSGALLVGLTGFLYLHVSYFQRYRYATTAQATRTSLSFAFGIAVLLLTSLMLAVLRAHAPAYVLAAHALWSRVSPLPGLSEVFILAPLVGLSCGMAENLVRLFMASDEPYLKDKTHLHVPDLRARMRVAALHRVANYTDAPLLLAVWRAMTLRELVLITLKSREVYVGLPMVLADPSIESPWLKLMPVAGGFRDSERLTCVLTTPYVEDEAGVLIPWAEVLSIIPLYPDFEVGVRTAR